MKSLRRTGRIEQGEALRCPMDIYYSAVYFTVQTGKVKYFSEHSSDSVNERYQAVEKVKDFSDHSLEQCK
jgi:hypothetical protein